MTSSLPRNFVHTARPIFIFHSNSRILQYIEETLDQVYEVLPVQEEASLLRAFEKKGRPDLTILGWNAMEHSAAMLRRVVAANGGAPVLLLCTSADANEMALAMQLGATGFLQKPFSKEELREAVAQQIALAQVRMAASPEQKETPLGDGSSFLRSSKRMCELEAQAALVARSDIPVLILGESGTGKEILAKYTHLMSNRSKRTFLKVNCAAMPAELLESELFGYEQGAFTGAIKSKPGKFEICDGGTIFLDEIGEMPAVLQAKLLHVLQDGSYSRLGGRSSMRSDVRVIAATNIDMKSAMANRTFREDLYYRLNGFSLTLPPLRDRKDEIPTFAHYFMQKGATKYAREPLSFSSALINALTQYSWPGNLRELENLMNRYLVIGDESAILSELAPYLDTIGDSTHAEVTSEKPGLKQLIRNLKGDAESVAIASVLEETKWNRRAAASEMKISYKALLYKIKQYDLSPPGS
jgi:two-component system response regulator AtoC